MVPAEPAWLTMADTGRVLPQKEVDHTEDISPAGWYSSHGQVGALHLIVPVQHLSRPGTAHSIQ